MNAEKQDLGRCPACDTPLIRNRQDERRHRYLALPGEDLPKKAFYPNFYHEIRAVWCPGCGLAKSIEIPRLEIRWINSEYLGWIQKKKFKQD